MCADADSFTDKWSGFLTSVWTQLGAALTVGLPAEDEYRSGAAPEVNAEGPQNRHAIRSLDDYAGYQTRSGLGSLDIGGGRSRIDE